MVVFVFMCFCFERTFWLCWSICGSLGGGTAIVIRLGFDFYRSFVGFMFLVGFMSLVNFIQGSKNERL